MTGASPGMTPRRVAEEIADRSFDQGVQPIAWKALADAIEKALHDQIEACAKVVEPANHDVMPCDCIEVLKGFFIQRCYCQNSGDLAGAETWCNGMNDAARIRAMKGLS